jgi:hypothetical protein
MDHRLLEIIACPVCNGKLYYSQDKQELICKLDSWLSAARRYSGAAGKEARPLAQRVKHEFRGHYSCAFASTRLPGNCWILTASR